MARIEIPEALRRDLGPEMKMDVHWVRVKLKDGRVFSNLVVRGGRYLTGRADAPGGEGPLPFESSDIAAVVRPAPWSATFRYVSAGLAACIVLVVVWRAVGSGLTVRPSRRRFAARLNSGVRAQMSLARQIAVTELVALLALLLVAAAMGGYAALEASLHSNSILGSSASAWVVFVYTAVLGAPVVAFLGAPGYLMLTLSGANRWWHVLLFGAAPGLAALPFSLGLGAAAVLCGTAVAGLTHTVMRRLGSNNSSKPTPLRGAA